MLLALTTATLSFVYLDFHVTRVKNKQQLNNKSPAQMIFICRAYGFV